MAFGFLGAMSPLRPRSPGNEIHAQSAVCWRGAVIDSVRRFKRSGAMSILLMSLAGGLMHQVASSNAFAQTPPAANGSPYYTDPATGIVYRKVHRTIERPVVQTEVKPQESTIYRPETVVDVTPETRTVYTPVVSYSWEPRVRGRWNPFVQPTLEYEHVPRTHWEARSQTVERRQTRTNWVTERRRVDVPQQVVKIQREEKIDYEAVGRVAPQQSMPPNSGQSAEAALAARLRPLDASTPISPFSATGSTNYPMVASQTLPPYSGSSRSSEQTGLRATDLNSGGSGGYSAPLPPTGIATNPLQTLWR
ncbi:MAG TPA: hypothetical protein DDZ51_12515 [Planctomycetaceae bacterium]|nr:hypothetical protein [Planctomycetaceae bacterium]